MIRASSVAFLSLTLALAGCSSIENFLVPESKSTMNLRENALNVSSSDIKKLNDKYVENAADILTSNLAVQEQNFRARVATYEAVKTDITDSAKAYLDMIATLRSQLQVGTTPGNPGMVALLEKAGATRNSLTGRVNDLQSFGNSISKDLTQVDFLSQTVVNALMLAGGTEADRTVFQQMKLEAGRISQDYLTLMQDISLMVDHQRAMAASLDREYEDLTELVRQGVNSNPLAVQAFQLRQPAAPEGVIAVSSPKIVVTDPVDTAKRAAEIAAPAKKSVTADNPTKIEKIADETVLFAVSKSNRTAGYEQRLYTAVSQAYADDQNIKFKVFGVSPIGADSAETSRLNETTSDEMDAVMQALLDMGVPASRMMLEMANSPKVDEPEVRLYKQ